MNIQSIDERREIVVPGDKEATIDYCVEDFLKIASGAIREKGFFCAALSGGSTPNAIFERLAKKQNLEKLQWDKVRLFWSDERSVPPEHADSNYRMALEAGLDSLPIPHENIFRMKAEENIEANAKAYEDLIKRHVPNQFFDLVMLGMGEDGHTASLFPHTKGLEVKDRYVIANFVPQKDTWRMSFTYKQIHMTHHLRIYVIGAGKAEILQKVLCSPFKPEEYPSQAVGSSTCKALWIADQSASHLINAPGCR